MGLAWGWGVVESFLRLQWLANVGLGGHQRSTHLDAAHGRPVQMRIEILVHLAAIQIDFALRLLVLHEVDPANGRGVAAVKLELQVLATGGMAMGIGKMGCGLWVVGCGMQCSSRKMEKQSSYICMQWTGEHKKTSNVTTYFCMVRPRPCSSLANRGVESSPYFPPLVKYKTRAGKYTQSKSKEKLLASLKSREVGANSSWRTGRFGIWMDSGWGWDKNLPETLACYMLAIEQTIPKCNLQWKSKGKERVEKRYPRARGGMHKELNRNAGGKSNQLQSLWQDIQRHRWKCECECESG